MGRSNIPVKTNEGAQEIKARALGLAPRIRTALLLVDGVKSVAELERLMAAAGVTSGALQLLLDKGLIRFQEEAQARPAATASTSPRGSADVSGSPVQAEHGGAEPEFLIEVPPLYSPSARKQADSLAPGGQISQMPMEDLFPDVIIPASQRNAASDADIDVASPLEVATLIELETILGEVTKIEMDTILGVATQLELTPTQLLARAQELDQQGVSPMVAPAVASPRLPPLAQAEYDFKMAVSNQQPVIPAAVLRMNLTVARAHLANALDQHLEIDGYALKQRVVASETRAELEQLFRLVEAALIQKLDRPAVLRITGVAQSLLER